MLHTLSQSPRRVLLTTDAVGGVWRQTLDLCAGLAEAGVEPVLLGLGPRPDATRALEAHAIPGLRLDWLELPLEWMAKDEAAFTPVPRAIAERAAFHGADVVHLMSPAQAAGIETPLPVVVTAHSCIATWFRAVRGSDVPPAWAWQKAWSARGFARADMATAPSRAFAQALEREYGPLPRLRVVHNGQPAGEPAPGGPRLPQALAAGRFWDDGKGLALLDAAAALARTPILAAGALAGPNGAQAAPPRHVQALGLLDAAAMREAYARARLFVSTALYEPFGLAVLEAAHAGLPLVLSDIPTFRTLWDEAALFVDPHDAAAVAAAIDRLCADERLCAELSAKARAAAEQYSFARHVHDMGAVYAAAGGQSAALAAQGGSH